MSFNPDTYPFADSNKATGWCPPYRTGGIVAHCPECGRLLLIDLYSMKCDGCGYQQTIHEPEVWA